MVNSRSGHSATLLDDNSVLVAGGFGSQSEDTAERYDPVRDRWTPAGKLNDPRISHAAVRPSDGRVLITGGNNSTGRGTVLSSAEWYNPTTNGWVPAPSMSTGRSGHTATLVNSIVLVVGGDDPAHSSAGAERYDPRSNTWSDGGSLSPGRTRHTATALSDGSVVLLGGEIQDTPVAGSSNYDPLTNRWEPST